MRKFVISICKRCNVKRFLNSIGICIFCECELKGRQEIGTEVKGNHNKNTWMSNKR